MVGSFWLEVVLKVGVLRRAKRLFLSIVPVSTLFLGNIKRSIPT
ncbi:MAG: lycopene cyclase domain-containing protein, partial [Actinobacteria bacterium]|nr:lycopene cyclase domain-containing protein [Actinomycetota bacterium]